LQRYLTITNFKGRILAAKNKQGGIMICKKAGYLPIPTIDWNEKYEKII
jgi:hypothetical protein